MSESGAQAKETKANVGARERVLLGLLAGFLVAVIGYPFPGYEGLFVGAVDWPAVVGWGIRVIGFSAAGGVWALLHENAATKLQVFELGLMAPAALTALVLVHIPDAKPAPPSAEALSLIDRAYAQDGGETNPGVVHKLWQGFLGTTQKPLYASSDTNPPQVAPGQVTTITVRVRDAQEQPLPGASVTISAGGGAFENGNTEFQGLTGVNGELAARWSCQQCAPAYGFSVAVSKAGYVNKQTITSVSIAH